MGTATEALKNGPPPDHGSLRECQRVVRDGARQVGGADLHGYPAPRCGLRAGRCLIPFAP